MTAPGRRDARVMRAVRHAERALSDPEADLGVEALAGVAGMSVFHFHRSFHAEVGEPVAAWVRRVRLERAASLLAHGSWPAGRVALASGYATQAAFTRAFTRHFGDPPSVWRERSGVTPWLGLTRRPRAAHGIEVLPLPARRLVAARHVGALSGVADALVPLVAWAEAQGRPGPEGTLVLVFLDDDTVVAPDAQRVELGLEVEPNASVPEGLAEVWTRAGPHAVRALGGTPAEIADAASRFLYAELPASGLQPSAYETVLEVPWRSALDWLADPARFASAPSVARVLHPVGGGDLLGEWQERESADSAARRPSPRR